ncbi:uncharacterized protein CTHT_0011520 [Thermochaetoides thermophila DSM 1495]|uniref:Uncharacterized protein n=1 Tax=Chaetomium thermophilum (strain DSM 1495 / CBS 144.50 / IMI 039719) TaxID=759272 RepID=G0S0W9_CHATD|nr:hypothetical protein CTHT_0011520 [Thermochaetoides thermophila DSM 1495]EGS22679.1 hypothetical protein CTHT_0011520 [Thermochaetoides thermophila DSM 1495]
MASYAQNQSFRPLQSPGGHAQAYHIQGHQQSHQYPQQQQQQQQHQYQYQQPPPPPPSQQQRQQQEESGGGGEGLRRLSSFVGLPPIRRNSTFSASLGLTADDFSLDDQNEPNQRQQQSKLSSSSSSSSQQLQAHQQTQQPHQLQQSQQSQQPQQSSQQGFQGNTKPQMLPSQQVSMPAAHPAMGHFMAASQPTGQYIQNVYRPSPGSQGSQVSQVSQISQGSTQGQSWQLQGQQPAQGFPGAVPGLAQGPAAHIPRVIAAQPGNLPPGMTGPMLPMGQHPYAVPIGPNGRPLPPHLWPNNLMQRFQPYGWKLEESHLQEPLQTPNRHRRSPSSTQQQSYALDKEMGLSESSSSKQRQKQEPNQTTQQSQQTLQDRAQQQNPVGPNASSEAFQKETQAPSHHDNKLSRVETHGSDVTGAGSTSAEGKQKRNSGFFSSLRSRFGHHTTEHHRSPSTALSNQGANDDADSEASIMEEASQQKQPGAGPGQKGAQAPADNISYSQSKDSLVAQAPSTPVNERLTPAPTPQPGPLEKKRTNLFGIGVHLKPGPSELPPQPGMPRTSTSTTVMSGPPPAGSNQNPPKKRFAALKNVKGVFHRSSPSDAPKTAPSPSFAVKLPGQAQQPQQPYPHDQLPGQPLFQTQGHGSPSNQAPGQPQVQLQGQSQPQLPPPSEPQIQPAQTSAQRQPQQPQAPEQPDSHPQPKTISQTLPPQNDTGPRLSHASTVQTAHDSQPAPPASDIGLRQSQTSTFLPGTGPQVDSAPQSKMPNTQTIPPSLRPGGPNAQFAPGLRQPSYGLPPSQPQPQLPAQRTSNADQEKAQKSTSGFFGFLKAKPDSKPPVQPQQQAQPGAKVQFIPYNPAHAQFLQGPYLSYGIRMAVGPDGRPVVGPDGRPLFIGPDGRPVILQSQPVFPGQGPFPPQTRLGPPGIAGNPGAPGSAPSPGPAALMSGAGESHQQSGPQSQQQPTLPEAQQITVQPVQQSPAPTQRSQFTSQPQTVNKPALAQEQDSAAAAEPAQLQQSSKQDGSKVPNPSPSISSSAVDSPVSQLSQPAVQLIMDQSRLLNEGPESVRQPFNLPPPENAQGQPQTSSAPTASSAPSAPSGTTTTDAGQKPTRSPSISVDEPVASFVSQFATENRSTPVGIPGELIEQGRSALASLRPRNTVPGQSSMPPSNAASTPGAQAGEPALGTQPVPPAQHSTQPGSQHPVGPQGPQLATSQSYFDGQGRQWTTRPGQLPPPQPPQQQSGPGGIHSNSFPTNAQQSKEKEQSTLSKLFKGTKVSNLVTSSPLKMEKDKSSMPSLLAAFKRGHREEKYQTATVPAQPTPGQQPTMQNISSATQSAQAAQRQPTQQQPQQSATASFPQHDRAVAVQFAPSVQGSGPSQPARPQQQSQKQPPKGAPIQEPQYAPVPIPAGYGFVHGEGRVAPAPAPLWVGPPHGPMYGQVQVPGQVPIVPGQVPVPVAIPRILPQQPIPASVATAQPAVSNPAYVQPTIAQPTPGSQAPSIAPSHTPSQASGQVPLTATPGPQSVPVQQPTSEPATAQVSMPPAQPFVSTATVPTTAVSSVSVVPVPVTSAALVSASQISPPGSLAPTPQPPAASISPPPPEETLSQPETAQSSTLPKDTSFKQETDLPPQQPPARQALSSNSLPNPNTDAQSASRSQPVRKVSGDDISSLPSQHAARTKEQETFPSSYITNYYATRHHTASPTSPHERTVSPPPAEPKSPHSPTNQDQLTTSTQRVAADNIYDATPRQSRPPPTQLQQPSQRQQPQTDTPSFIIVNDPEAPAQPSVRAFQQELQPAPPANYFVISGETIVNAPPVTAPSSTTTSQSTPASAPAPAMVPPQSGLLNSHAATTANNHTSSSENERSFDSDMSDESPVIQSATIATVQQASPTEAGTTSSNNPQSPPPITIQPAAVLAKNDVAIFERAKKKAEEQREMEMRMVLEEKIPVLAEIEDEQSKNKKDLDDIPVMSATSYPGQEWNPYGEGGFEDWND